MRVKAVSVVPFAAPLPDQVMAPTLRFLKPMVPMLAICVLLDQTLSWSPASWAVSATLAPEPTLIEGTERPTKLTKADVLPISTAPVLLTRNSFAVLEPTTNAGAVPIAAVGLTESWPHGLDEPTPTKPAVVNVV